MGVAAHPDRLGFARPRHRDLGRLGHEAMQARLMASDTLELMANHLDRRHLAPPVHRQQAGHRRVIERMGGWFSSGSDFRRHFFTPSNTSLRCANFHSPSTRLMVSV